MQRPKKRFSRSMLGTALIFAAISLLSGCNSGQKKEEEPKVTEPRRDDRAGQGGQIPKQCKSIKALEILDDGNTVISRLKENSWVAWQVDTGEVKARGISLNYFAASPNGQYLLSQISSRKYQLLELREGSYIQKTMFKLKSMEKPSLRISQDSKYVVIRHKPYGSRGLDRFDLYDIDKNTFSKSFKAAGIKYIKLDRYGGLVIGYNNGFDKFIARYDLSSLEEMYRIELPFYQSFSYMEVAGNRIIAKSRGTYFTYNLENGERLFQNQYKHIYDLDASSGLALVANGWEEVSIVALEDGRSIFSGSSPKEVILSSCQIKTGPLRIACRERVDQNKIYVWGVESGKSVLTCY